MWATLQSEGTLRRSMARIRKTCEVCGQENVAHYQYGKDPELVFTHAKHRESARHVAAVKAAADAVLEAKENAPPESPTER